MDDGWNKLWWNGPWMAPSKIVSSGPDFQPRWPPSFKVWFHLSNWFQTRRFLCEFPIGFYVKLSSAVGAILVKGTNRRTYFWKRTIKGDEVKKNLLLWNYWVNLNQTLLNWSLGGPLPKLCPTLQTSDQDGVKLSSAVGPSWSKGLTTWHIFGREPSNDYFIKM
jgi:hypothetical protein